MTELKESFHSKRDAHRPIALVRVHLVEGLISQVDWWPCTGIMRYQRGRAYLARSPNNGRRLKSRFSFAMCLS